MLREQRLGTQPGTLMNWQEYQTAVALLYEQAEGFGKVQRNVRIPDRDTGSMRQIDVLITLTERGHDLQILVDAKFRKESLDVKDVEEVSALAVAVRASKAIIVAANGWTEPARRKACSLDMDLRLLPLEEALDLIVPDKWQMCTQCEEDCIVLDQDGMQEHRGLWLWWLAGQCRHCHAALVHCQDCGTLFEIPLGGEYSCYCGHRWSATKEGVFIHLSSWG